MPGSQPPQVSAFPLYAPEEGRKSLATLKELEAEHGIVATSTTVACVAIMAAPKAEYLAVGPERTKASLLLKQEQKQGLPGSYKLQNLLVAVKTLHSEQTAYTFPVFQVTGVPHPQSRSIPQLTRLHKEVADSSNMLLLPGTSSIHSLLLSLSPAVKILPTPQSHCSRKPSPSLVFLYPRQDPAQPSLPAAPPLFTLPLPNKCIVDTTPGQSAFCVAFWVTGTLRALYSFTQFSIHTSVFGERPAARGLCLGMTLPVHELEHRVCFCIESSIRTNHAFPFAPNHLLLLQKGEPHDRLPRVFQPLA